MQDSAYTLKPYLHYRALLPRDGDRIVRAAWFQYTTWLGGAIDDPTSDDDVIAWLEQIISEKVNNPRSSFYIHGR